MSTFCGKLFHKVDHEAATTDTQNHKTFILKRKYSF